MDEAPKQRRSLLAGFGLWIAAFGLVVIGSGTLLALALGSGYFVLLGASGLLCCLGLGLVSWWPRWRKRGVAIVALAVCLVLPVALPIPRAQNPGALIRSVSIFGGDGGTPWFSGLPEVSLVATGEQVGWAAPERETIAKQGPVSAIYPDLEGAGIFVRSESVVLDSWVFDRGHYFFAAPPGGGPAPLIVFLHGNGGSFRSFPYWLAPRATARGFAVAFPTWGFGSWRSPEAAERVLAVIDHAARSGRVDPRRVILCGISAGAIGTVRIQCAHPERFLAAVCISGAPLGPVDGARCARVPYYAVHGARDGHLPIEASRRLAGAIRDAGGAVTFRELPEADHTLLLLRPEETIEGVLDWTDAVLRGSR